MFKITYLTVKKRTEAGKLCKLRNLESLTILRNVVILKLREHARMRKDCGPLKHAVMIFKNYELSSLINSKFKKFIVLFIPISYL